jgi:sulfite exporter TauE/SafE
VIQTLDLLGFLTLGLLGGFGHCVGMCSPFVLFVSRRYAGAEGGGRAALAAQGWYTAGRIVTYALLGLVAGAVGGAVESAGALVGLRRGAAVVAGGVLVAWALAALSDFRWIGCSGRWAPPSSKGFGRVAAALGRRVPGQPLAA